jgi:hypothetical protein
MQRFFIYFLVFIPKKKQREMYDFLKKRSCGQITARQFRIAETTRRSYLVELSNRKEMSFSQRGK